MVRRAGRPRRGELGETVGARLRQLAALYPERDDETGLLYRSRADLKRETGSIILFAIIGSRRGQFSLHRLSLLEREQRTPSEWSDWIDEHIERIYEESVLPGIFFRSGISWRLVQIVGFINAEKT